MNINLWFILLRVLYSYENRFPLFKVDPLKEALFLIKTFLNLSPIFYRKILLIVLKGIVLQTSGKTTITLLYNVRADKIFTSLSLT